MCFWDSKSGRCIRRITFSDGPATPVAWSPDGTRIVCGAAGNGPRVLDPGTGKAAGKLSGGGGKINDAAWSPDGKTLATAGDDKKASIWDAETGRPRQALAHPENVWHVAFSPDGKLLASGDAAGVVRIWDLAAGKELPTKEPMSHLAVGNYKGVNALAFSPDGQRLASAGNDALRVWSTSSRTKLREFAGGVSCLSWSSDGKDLVSRGPGNNLLCRDMAAATTKWSVSGADPFGIVKQLLSSPTGGTLAVVGRHHQAFGDRPRLWLWRLGSRSARVVDSIPTHGLGTWPVVWSPDGLVAHPAANGTWAWLDPESGKRAEFLAMAPNNDSLVWSSNRRTLANGPDTAGAVRIIDVASGKVLRTLKTGQPGVQVYQVFALSPDGNTLYTRHGDRTVRSWDIAVGGEVKGTLVGKFKSADCISCSPDGNQLALAAGAACEIIDTRTGATRSLTHAIGLKISSVSDAIWSSDGRTLASGGGERVFVWDVETGKSRRRFTGPYAFSGFAKATTLGWLGGERYIAAAMESYIHIWDVTSGQLVATLFLLGEAEGQQLSEAKGIVFTPEGHYRCSPGVEKDLVYVALTDAGEQITLSPAEFQQKYGWKNDPAKAAINAEGGARAFGVR